MRKALETSPLRLKLGRNSDDESQGTLIDQQTDRVRAPSGHSAPRASDFLSPAFQNADVAICLQERTLQFIARAISLPERLVHFTQANAMPPKHALEDLAVACNEHWHAF